MTRIAILDDYQNVALDLADWNGLAGACTVTVFGEHLGTNEECPTALSNQIGADQSAV